MNTNESIKNSVFDQFTNKYSLSKTLRFELRIPKDFPDTQTMLEKNNVFEVDRIKQEKYKKVKPWIDKLHREFIQDSLSAFTFRDLHEYSDALTTWKNDKKSKEAQKKLEKVEDALRKEVADQFDNTAKRWAEKYPDLKLKKLDTGILFEEGVFRVLAKRYGEEEDTTFEVEDGSVVSFFDDWKGCKGYFKKFFQTRKNFYSDGNEATAVSYRIVNQNLRRFHANIELYNKIKDRIDLSTIEGELGVSCDEIFSLGNYSTCLLQEGIDLYNRVLGGYVDKATDAKIPGINQAINEYRQTNSGDKLNFLAMLDRQIHSEKDKFIEAIETDAELIGHLRKFKIASDKKLQSFKNLIEDFSVNTEAYSLEKVYLSSSAFERNAGRWLGDYAAFERRLVEIGKAKEWKDAYKKLGQTPPEEKDGRIKHPDFLICAHIAHALTEIGSGVWKEKHEEEISGFSELDGFGKLLQIIRSEVEQQFVRKGEDGVEAGYTPCQDKITNWLDSNPQSIDDASKVLIKEYADSALIIYQIAKYFAVEKKRRWLENFDLDDRFYSAVTTGYKTTFHDASDDFDDAYTEIVKGYNALRNYLTQKPYSTDKWVLNFNNQNLADGWDKNKEKDNSAIILRKNGRYYLGIMHKEHRDLFLDKNANSFSGVDFEKMNYKQIADPSKDIHNLIWNKSDESIKRATKWETKAAEWPQDIVRIKKAKSYTKENFNRADFNTFIDYMKKCASGYWSEFNLAFMPTSQYENINDFTNEILRQGYKVYFDQGISEAYIREKNEAGELYIFEIHNKDWNLKDGKTKTGAKNIHTLYWEQLFSDANAQNNFAFKLNGGAELFFRPKTDEKKLGTKLINGRPTVSHWRYSHDKIFLHCPITLNRVSEDKNPYTMDGDIREAVISNEDVRVLGIDRGEKHLAYYSVIDQKGKIVDHGSFNAINGVNYADVLDKKAGERDAARRDWKDVEQIKDTKRGYVSLVVREIVNLAIEHNAIIVLEDLNMRFKQIRGGIEKSIYQQLEKQLIDKLSFLVSKQETDATKCGHPLRAYQLASPFSSFREMGKQTGIVFYAAAGYTSRTCPQCGYRRNVRFQYENIEQAERVLDQLDTFAYDANSGGFVVSYSLRKFLNPEQLKSSKAKNQLYEDEERKDSFTIKTNNAIRYKWIPNQSPRLRALAEGIGVSVEEGEEDESQTRRGKTKRFELTVYLRGALKEFGISPESGNLREEIKLVKSKNLYEKIFFAIFLLTETRQTISGKDVDYIHCAECGLDTREQFQNLEFNGDANGAYNVARKGIMILEKIKQYKNQFGGVEKMGWGDMSISITEWDKFTQNNILDK